MIRKIREAFFREMNVFNKRKCKKYRQFLPRRQKLSVFICAFVRTIQAETVRGECVQKNGQKRSRRKKCLDMRYFLL